MTKIISLVILQSLLFCFTFFPTAYSANNLIEPTCKQTPLFELCVSILESDPQSSTANVSGLAVIAANSAEAKASVTLNVAHELLQNATDHDLKKALSACIEYYDTMVRFDIPAAIDGIKKGDPKYALECAADAVKDVQGCESSIVKISTRPLYGSNKVVQNILIIFQSIASLLH